MISDLEAPRAWSMAQQSSREFASADSKKGAEDARVQERRIYAKVSLNACSGPQHVHRPTSSHLIKDAQSLQGIGHIDVA
jgi:hypothetical protein